MTDVGAVVMALAAAAGAWAAYPIPRWWGALLVAAALCLRRPALLCIGALLLASSLSARSWTGLRPPRTAPWAGAVTLVGDPAPAFGGTRVVVKAGRARVEAWARGASARVLRGRLAGERVKLAGRIEPLSGRARAILVRRHVAARLTVERVDGWAPGDPLSRLANGIRRTLLSGSASLSPDGRSLFAGFVLGDDRNQPPEIVSDFRASGLTHLLVVSGQNVAFVLALAAPLLVRSGIRTRVMAGVAVLLVFGTLTRWEPSVLRAAAMAAVALLAVGLGRPVSRLRVLALAVTGLLLVDPLLVGSIGFLLSVGASCGIALLAGPLTAILPGPRPLASAVAVTLAAQIGVAPVLVPAFGGIPVSALPANLLAVPVAGPLTLWGMAAGLPAGLLGPPLATVLHLPTGVMVGWVAAVARHAAELPLGRFQGPHVVALAVLLVLGVVSARGGWDGWRRLCGLGSVAVIGAAIVPALRPGPVSDRVVAPGARLWRHGGAAVVVVDGARSPEVLLKGLRSASVRRLDVLVLSRPGAGDARAAAPVLSRIPARLVLAPQDVRLAGAQVPAPGTELVAGGLVVRVKSVSPRLTVDVRSASP